jgi:hypothetical protein
MTPQTRPTRADVLGRRPPTVPVIQLLAVARTSEWVFLATTSIGGPGADAPWTVPAMRFLASDPARSRRRFEYYIGLYTDLPISGRPDSPNKARDNHFQQAPGYV